MKYVLLALLFISLPPKPSRADCPPNAPEAGLELVHLVTEVGATNFPADRRDGPFIEMDPSKTLIATGTLLNGKLDGYFQVLFNHEGTERTVFEARFSRGAADGVWAFWSPNGDLCADGYAGP
jgi:hypothetical protein